jgi:hypothetical protein
VKLYSVYTGLDDCAEHFASLREAERCARLALADTSLDAIEIELHEVVPLTKANIIEILNSQGGRWSRSSHTVKTIRRKEKQP